MTDPAGGGAAGSDPGGGAGPGLAGGGGAAGAALFDTSIGRVGIAWRGRAVIGVQLPERSDASTRQRLVTLAGTSVTMAEPPPPMMAAIDAITALLEGEPRDLGFVEVDLDRVSDFDRAVYEITRAIPPGQSLTYGQVAERLGEAGDARAAQAVGRSLGANPYPIVIPCHRVLGAGGRLTGFSAPGGVETKRRILLIEGCPAVPPSLFD